MALQGIMINSRQEWNLEYLLKLREKFMQQEYPLDLINQQFARALSVDRADLLLADPSNRKKPKRRIVAPLIVTNSPANPPYKKWINEELSILHRDPQMKKTFPYINVVTRQNQNIKRRIMRNRFREDDQDDIQTTNVLPAGNFKFHEGRCMCCMRMARPGTWPRRPRGSTLSRDTTTPAKPHSVCMWSPVGSVLPNTQGRPPRQ